MIYVIPEDRRMGFGKKLAGKVGIWLFQFFSFFLVLFCILGSFNGKGKEVFFWVVAGCMKVEMTYTS